MSAVIDIIALCRAARGREDETYHTLAAVVEPTCQEQGCLRYRLYRDRTEPRDFYFVESWSDEQALSAHYANDASLRLKERLQDLLSEAATISTLERLA